MVYNNCGWTVGEGELICLSICRWMRMMMIIIVGGRKTNRGLWLLTTSIELSLVLSFVLWRRWWWWFLLTIYVLWRWSTDRPSDLSSAVQPSGMGGDGHWEFCSDHEFDLMLLECGWVPVLGRLWSMKIITTTGISKYYHRSLVSSEESDRNLTGCISIKQTTTLIYFGYKELSGEMQCWYLPGMVVDVYTGWHGRQTIILARLGN